MQPPNQHSRINLIELKAQLIKRLGPERSKQYFHYLNKLLSLKLSKVEFNKICFRVLGRENVRLHNLLIHAILKNACNAKVPPPQVISRDSQQNGDLLLSPREAICRASTGLIAKVDAASHESTITNDIVISGNGNLTSYDIWKPMQHCQEVLCKADNGRDVMPSDTKKFSLTDGSVDDFLSQDSRVETELLAVKDGNDSSTRSTLQAPLGIPFFSGSMSHTQGALPSAGSGSCAKSYDIGGLHDSETLRERMQHIAALEGLGGVSLECANILNNALDVFLKRLIKTSIELVGTRHGCNLKTNKTFKHHLYGNLVNGVLPSYHDQVQHGSRDFDRIDDQNSYKLISLLDFKAAMELNPQKLGQHWPLLLEKIYMYSLEG